MYGFEFGALFSSGRLQSWLHFTARTQQNTNSLNTLIEQHVLKIWSIEHDELKEAIDWNDWSNRLIGNNGSINSVHILRVYCFCTLMMSQHCRQGHITWTLVLSWWAKLLTRNENAPNAKLEFLRVLNPVLNQVLTGFEWFMRLIVLKCQNIRKLFFHCRTHTMCVYRLQFLDCSRRKKILFFKHFVCWADWKERKKIDFY